VRLLPVGLVVFVCTACLLLGHTWVRLAELPPEVASHFDGAGRPDGWVDRASFVRTTWIMNGLMIVLFAAVALALPRLPARLINLPHREYWLAPARADATLADLVGWFLILGGWLHLFLLFLQHQIVQANLAPSGPLDRFWVALGIYMAGTLGWVVYLVVRFNRPGREAER